MGETPRATLNGLAVVAPAWLWTVAPSEWYDRHGRRVENYAPPETAAARQALATVIGTDGRTLLDASEAATAPRWLREIPAVQSLQRVWAEQDIDVGGTHVWRAVQRRRYIGLAKIHLQHVITAAAITVVRLATWLEGTATARRSAFAALAA